MPSWVSPVKASATLDMLEIDTEGMDARDTQEESIEPYLIQQGFLVRIPCGHQITERGRLDALLTRQHDETTLLLATWRAEMKNRAKSSVGVMSRK